MAIKAKKTIPYNFSEKHREYIRNCRDCIYNVAEGAVRAGKTVDNVIAFCRELCRTPDKLHLATASTAPTAKLVIGDCNGFGIEHYFRGQRKHTARTFPNRVGFTVVSNSGTLVFVCYSVKSFAMAIK